MPDFEDIELDEIYMRRAIELAVLGEGWCHPNPKVGAVIVKDGRIIGEGYHAKRGEPHAERNAIASLTESAEGATIYVTLEPCCHHGKTPPCTEAIIENGISRVVIGSRDPNPKVSGGGVKLLREAGIEVVEDFMMEECDEINPVFFHYITKKTPYVTLKYAMTMDGKIATKTGGSKWISNEMSREYVQYLRHSNMGIMAGIGTVLTDNPRLNCRMEGGRNPVKIICDSTLKMAEHMDFSVFDEGNLIIATAVSKETPIFLRKKRDLEEAGAKVVNLPGPEGKVDIKALIQYLGNEEIDSLLVEGGGEINEALLREGLVDEVVVFLAPKAFGGDGKGPVMGQGVSDPNDAYGFALKDIQYFGDDLMIRYIKNGEDL